MSRSPNRRSSLEGGSSKTKPRSCGNQSADESLLNGRLRVLSPAVRTSEPTSSAAAETNNCVRTLESEHERPHRRSQELGLLVAGSPCSDYSSVCVGSRAICVLMNSRSRVCGVFGTLIRDRSRAGGSSPLTSSLGSATAKMSRDPGGSRRPTIPLGISTATAVLTL